MNFHAGKINGLMKYSTHMIVMSKASRIVVEECSHLYNSENRDISFIDYKDRNVKIGKSAKEIKKSSSLK